MPSPFRIAPSTSAYLPAASAAEPQQRFIETLKQLMQADPRAIPTVLSAVGVRTEACDRQAILDRQNPTGQKRGGLGFGAYASVAIPQHGAVFCNMNTFALRQAELSPLMLTGLNPESGRFNLQCDGATVAGGTLLAVPAWGRGRLSSGRMALEVLQQHGARNLVGIIGDTRCTLFDRDEACAFCMMDGGANNAPRSIDEIREAVRLAVADRAIYNLTLTTGFLTDRDVVQLAPGLRALKSELPNGALAFEMNPVRSPSESIFSLLRMFGVDTVMIPLDCYSRAAQESLLPGKAAALAEAFWENVASAVRVFGRGNVTSSLIVGVEPLEETLKGVRALVEQGVIPEPVPVRWDDTLLVQRSSVPVTDPSDLLEVRRVILQVLEQSRLGGQTHAGCATCGGCGGINVNALPPSP